MEPLVIVSTGVANTASVSAAIRRCGFDAELTDSADRVRSAVRVVLPGVGSFGTGMRRLRERGLDEAIHERVAEQRPLLAICLGLQLLCARSEESPGVEGIGVIKGTVRRLTQGVRAPQFGWNRVEAAGTDLLTSGYAYYANSFCLAEDPDGWGVATTTHGKRFVAALERGVVLACQFHPELSGQWGGELIKNWIVRAEKGARC